MSVLPGAPDPGRGREPIDPFARAPGGVYDDGLVVVRRGRGRAASRRRAAVRTMHFDLHTSAARVEVSHGLDATTVDDDLAGLLAGELFAPGWLRGAEVFERLFTGVVLTCAEDPVDAWESFYRNTLRSVDAALEVDVPGRPAPPSGAGGESGHGCIADYAPVYRRAEDLLVGRSVLDLGCCFGFASVRIAAGGRRVRAVDVNPGFVALLAAVAPRLGAPLRAEVGDATRLGRIEPADTVLALHLLEHLDAREGEAALRQAMAAAGSRVVVAVPLEEEADATWGHVRTIALRDLADWGRASGWAFGVEEWHGGWLVLDRPA